MTRDEFEHRVAATWCSRLGGLLHYVLHEWAPLESLSPVSTRDYALQLMDLTAAFDESDEHLAQLGAVADALAAYVATPNPDTRAAVAAVLADCPRKWVADVCRKELGEAAVTLRRTEKWP